MVISRRSLLLAGAAFPASAYAQCVTNAPAVDACRGGVRITAPSLPPGVTLDLNFMTPGTLDPRITFTRASGATYTDASGVIQMAATNAPRWDYDPVTHVLRGLLIEEQRTNVGLFSGDISNSWWQKAGNIAAAPTVTGNQVTSPDGTVTASRIAYPAVSGAGAFSLFFESFTSSVMPFSLSIWLRGNAGGEQIYLSTTDNTTRYSSPRFTLTTQWQRFVLITPALGASVSWFWFIGTDLRDGTQTSTPAQTIYAWGAQVTEGAFATSYIPTTTVAVTRAVDLASMAYTPSPIGTYQAEFIPAGAAAGLPYIICGNAGSPSMAIGADSRLIASIKSGAAVFSAIPPSMTFNAVNKTAFGYATGASKAAVNGTLLGTSAAALTVTGTSIQFGSDGVAPGNNVLNGALRVVRFWSRVLSDAEMQQVTT